MSYEFKCMQCDYESNDRSSVQMCEKRHRCTDEGHKQVGVIYDFKVTNTKCDCGKETPEVSGKLSDQQQQAFTSELMNLAGFNTLVNKYYM